MASLLPLPPFITEGLDALFELSSEYLNGSPFEALVALTVLAAIIDIPITQHKTVYGDTVGYGLSVSFQLYILTITFPPEAGSLGQYLVNVLHLWAMRLALYLLFRDKMGWSRASDSETRVKRLTVALGLSAYYALVSIPILYALRYPVTDPSYDILVWSGIAVSCAGLVLETVADCHKFWIKHNQLDLNKFCGPADGVYKLSRHPNYAGEIMVWLGVWMACLPSFIFSVSAAIASTVGFLMLCCILLFEASIRVEREQKRKYGGQIKYERWKEQVPMCVMPVAPLLTAELPGLLKFPFGTRV